MKKLLSLLLVCILLLSLAPAALAKSETLELDAEVASLNEVSNTIALKARDEDYYQLIDVKGKVLVPASEEYTYMAPWDGFFLVEKASEDELPRKGLLAGDGTLLVPPKYHDIDVISDRWQVGILLTPSDEDGWDYSFSSLFSDDESFYYIESTEFYFNGEFVGSLPRAQCIGSAEAYGDYLCIYTEDFDPVFYNSKLEPSPYRSSSSEEFDWDYVGDTIVYYHQGTGQVAFQPDCSLAPEELDSPYLYAEGVLYDIKGNELARFPREYEYVFGFEDGFAFAELDDKYGVVNLKGEEILPPEYERLGDYESYLFPLGYISAVKDGLVGFLDAKGQVSCDFVYPIEDVVLWGTFATLQDEDDNTIVLSAAVGELPERYTWVYFPEDCCKAFVAENDKEEMGAVDLQGKTLIPFSSKNLDIEISVDGSVALVYTSDDQFVIYRF